jgi:RNA polymerase sigma-70 factor (ECF subfamily)
MSAPLSDSHLAFTRVFVANQAAFHGYLVSLVQDVHAADDLLQELAVRLWSKFGSYDPQRPFIAWGLGFARLLAMEWRRKQSRLPLPLDETTLGKLADEAQDHAERHDERRDALHDCLKSLTAHQRRTLHLRYHEELPVAKIASAWQRTEMAIYKVLKHAHQALFDCISKTLASQKP